MRLRSVALVVVVGLLLGVVLSAFPVGVTVQNGIARLVIGNRVSAQEADYTCDGIDDNVEFQAAIDALDAGGGMLYVLAGTYSFSDTVTRGISCVSVVGLGGASLFENDNATALFSAGGNKWIFANLWTDGGGLDMGVTEDWCWLNVGVYETLYPVLTSEGGVLSMEIHGNEWHTVAFATVASVTAVNATLNDALDSIATVESDLSSLNATIEGFAGDIAAVESGLSALNVTVVNIQSDLSDLDATVLTLNSTVVGLQADFLTLNSTVYGLVSTVSGLNTSVNSLTSSVTSLNSTVNSLTSSVTSLNSTVINYGTVAIVYVIDGGGSAITTGVKGFLEIPFGCTVKNWTAVADVAGAVQVDLWRDTYANFPPTDADSMCSGKEVKIIATNQKGQDTDITDWTTTAISAGNLLGFNVDSCASITRLTVTITATRN